MSLKHTFIVDASYNLERKVTGIGIVIHETYKPNRSGIIVAEISELYANIPVNVSEKFAVFRALEIACERNYQIVHIFSDYNSMRKQLKYAYEKKTMINGDNFHTQLLNHANTLKDVKFKYKVRRKNQMAHRLAKNAVTDLNPKQHHIFLI